MAKRFFSTELLDDPWVMDLPNKYKLFWVYLLTKCDYTGIWQVNYKSAQFYVGEHLEPVECERMFNSRIIKIEEGKYWFLPKFVEFQYGSELSYANPAVRKVIYKLQSEGLLSLLPNIKIKGLPSTFVGAEEKEEEEVKEKEEEKKEYKKIPFEQFWALYDKKVGNQKELKKKWEDLSLKNQEKVLSHIPKYKLAQPDKQYRKNPKSYLNQKSWEDEIIASATSLPESMTMKEAREFGISQTVLNSKYQFNQASGKFYLK